VRDIFIVRVNIDSLRRKMGLCLRPEDKAELLDGFMYATTGGEPQPSMPPRWQDGYAVGVESYERARAHQTRMSEMGKQSANLRSNLGCNIGSNIGSNQAIKPSSHQASNPTSHQPEPTEVDVVGPEMPTKSGVGYRLPRSLYDTMAQAYPGIGIDRELDKMVAWLVGNHDRRKTSRGMPKFINGWLQRCEPAAPSATVEDDGPSEADTMACFAIADEVKARGAK
jgi:hypothetical protein